MNPTSILARETRLPAPAARRQPAARADFQLPEPATDARDRPALVMRDRGDRPAAKIDRTRPEQADQAQGAHSEELRGSERSREVRQDGEARNNRAERGEGSERRSARADEVSSRDASRRDKMKQTGDDQTGAAPENAAEPSPEQPVSAEAAALELLAKTVADTTIETTAQTSTEKLASPDALAGDGQPPAEGAAAPTGTTPPAQALALPAGSAPVEAKPETSVSQAEPDAIIGESGAKPQRSAPAHMAAKGRELKDALTDQTTSSSDDATGSATVQEKPDASGKAQTDGPQAATRPVQEAKAEAVSGQPQPAAARFEVLPPGLAALPDNARALQAQLSEARPQAGAHPHGARGPEAPPTSLSALPIEIGFRALEGTKRFDIRLDPAELGRVDVSLSFDKDGEVTAKLTVDRVETLHLLQRDAKTLERAFDQAGLRTSDAGVQISLSDRNAGNGGGFQAEQDRARGAGRRDEAEQIPGPVNEIIPQRRLRLGGVDVNI